MERIFAKDTISKVDTYVKVYGWVQSRRDHGKLIFIDLRDSSGFLQLVFRPEDADLYKAADSLRSEWVIAVEGVIRARPTGMENPDIETGAVELPVEKLEILSRASPPPFPIDTDGRDIEEEVRLKYRYLDLRRPRLQKNLRLRSRLVQSAREYLFKHDFTEIETPLLTKSTPEGSRDFLVPSRLHPGKFYALPQSPQQYKELLMVAGFERYFQIARALRDEDLRADRGFEHTQIDIEMSFVEQKDVMRVAEGATMAICETCGAEVKEKPFPVFSYAEAVEKFGADKFDLRNESDKTKGMLAFAWVKDFPLFEKDKNGTLTYSHNPFTAPRSEDKEKLFSGNDLGSIVSLQYDLVCNGAEVGGGSIRIHESQVLEKVFEILGHSKTEIQEKFGHMLEAFGFGAPPHGGIALGVDRLAMVMTGEEYLREVQAFPMTSGGRTAVMAAPSEADSKQLAELGLEVRAPKKR